jgi:ribonuclease HII
MIGVDEVGRGCWAGPLLVVAAKATADLPPDLTDSKLLTKTQRGRILKELIFCCAFGEGWVSAREIDRKGLSSSLRLGIKRALRNLGASYEDEIIFDGKVNYVDPKFIYAKCEVDADLNIPIVSAASIYAKVTRDKFMAELGLKHPAYGFDKHVGYGTRVHAEALSKHGVLEDVHRMSFRPIAKLLEL